MLFFQSLIAGKDTQTHRLSFSKHFQNQDGLETKEADKADQWPELVQDIEGDMPIVRTAKT